VGKEGGGRKEKWRRWTAEEKRDNDSEYMNEYFSSFLLNPFRGGKQRSWNCSRNTSWQPSKNALSSLIIRIVIFVTVCSSKTTHGFIQGWYISNIPWKTNQQKNENII
jgi:hypothetical protein